MDWIAITCWAVLGVSGLVTLWAIIWDRPRGRLRCRKCAYDMSGGGLRCPECGREHKSERSLRKARRKWKTAIIGLLLGSLSYYPMARQELTAQEGAWGLVPTVVLAAICDPQDYMRNNWSSPSRVTAVFSCRIDNNLGSGIARSIWAHRLRDHLEATMPQSELKIQCEVVNLSSIAPVSGRLERWHGMNCFGPYGDINTTLMKSNRAAYDLLDFIGGSPATSEGLQDCIESRWAKLVGDRLILVATPEIIHEFRERLNDLELHEWRFGTKPAKFVLSGSQCCVLYRFRELPPNPSWYEDDRGIWTIMADIQRRCRPDVWVSMGGEDAMQIGVGNAIAISASAEHHNQIMAYLGSSEFKTLYATVIDSSR